MSSAFNSGVKSKDMNHRLMVSIILASTGFQIYTVKKMKYRKIRLTGFSIPYLAYCIVFYQTWKDGC